LVGIQIIYDWNVTVLVRAAWAILSNNESITYPS